MRRCYVCKCTPTYLRNYYYFSFCWNCFLKYIWSPCKRYNEVLKIFLPPATSSVSEILSQQSLAKCSPTKLNLNNIPNLKKNNTIQSESNIKNNKFNTAEKNKHRSMQSLNARYAKTLDLNSKIGDHESTFKVSYKAKETKCVSKGELNLNKIENRYKKPDSGQYHNKLTNYHYNSEIDTYCNKIEKLTRMYLKPSCEELEIRATNL